jgi:hypothetical protein
MMVLVMAQDLQFLKEWISFIAHKASIVLLELLPKFRALRESSANFLAEDRLVKRVPHVPLGISAPMHRQKLCAVPESTVQV